MSTFVVRNMAIAGLHYLGSSLLIVNIPPTSANKCESPTSLRINDTHKQDPLNLEWRGTGGQLGEIVNCGSSRHSSESFPTRLWTSVCLPDPSMSVPHATSPLQL